MLKWSNLKFTFEVGGSLVAADAMFREPCYSFYWFCNFILYALRLPFQGAGKRPGQ